jgi:hypothetical protein
LKGWIDTLGSSLDHRGRRYHEESGAGKIHRSMQISTSKSIAVAGFIPTLSAVPEMRDQVASWT